jgi:hypothetical protein
MPDFGNCLGKNLAIAQINKTLRNNHKLNPNPFHLTDAEAPSINPAQQNKNVCNLP